MSRTFSRATRNRWDMVASVGWIAGRRPGANRSARLRVDQSGVVAAADQPCLAAGVGGRRGRVFHYRPVAEAAREAREQGRLRRHAATAAGTVGAVGDGHVVAAALDGGAAAADEG